MMFRKFLASPLLQCLSFGKRNDSGYVLWETYHSNWFHRSFINYENGDQNHKDFKRSRKEMKKLFQPCMIYDVNDENENNIEFIVHDKNDHLNDVE
jgi:hypothetical protein